MSKNFDINTFLKEVHRKYFGRNLVLFICGVVISSITFNLFYQRYNIVVSGTSGLSVLISNYINFDISVILLILNLLCLMIGFIFFGWEYAVKMLAITFISPLFVKSTSLITNMIDLGNTSLFLIMIVGGGLSGYSNGLIRNSGYSPGGFYSIYEVMHKYLHISIGSANILVNGIMIILGGFTFGMEMAIYAIISLLVSSYIVDKVTIGISDNKVFYIVTEKPFEVTEYISDHLHYDFTLINARGGYTNKKKNMLMSVISTRDYVNLKEMVIGIDPKAFFLIVDAYESSVKKKM